MLQAMGSGWLRATGSHVDELARLAESPGARDTADCKYITFHRTHLPLFPSAMAEDVGALIDVMKPRYPLRHVRGISLRDYQDEAVQFISGRQGSLLLHDLGLGKTIMALSAAGLPALILVPVTASHVWLLEAQRMGLSTQVLRGLSGTSDHIKPNADVYLLTYGSAAGWTGYFSTMGAGPRIHTVIADEAHVMQSKAVTWTKAFKKIQAKRTILLSATPMRNRLSSFWSLLECAAPASFGKHWDFRRRYCGAEPGPYGGLQDHGVTNGPELVARLTEIAIRRTWEDPALADLRPVLHRSVEPIGLTDEALARVIDQSLDAVHGLGEKGVMLAFMTAQRLAIGIAKAKWLVSSKLLALTRWKDTCRRIILWCWHHEVARELRVAGELWGWPVDVVTGEADSIKRGAVLKEWQFGDPSQPRLLVATLGAMGASVNLTTAQAAIFVELDWAPLSLVQAEKRHHRFGSAFDEVFSVYLTVPGTVDERITRVLVEKMTEVEQIIGTNDQFGQLDAMLNQEKYSSDTEVLADVARRIMAGER